MTATTPRTFIMKPWQAKAAAAGKLSLLVVPVKPQPADVRGLVAAYCESLGCTRYMGQREFTERHCPFQIGEELIGKETWGTLPTGPIYRASVSDEDDCGLIAWGTPETMPGELARFRRTITSIVVKRACEVTHDEACAMGFNTIVARTAGGGSIGPLDDFREQWHVDYPRWPLDSEWSWSWLIGVESPPAFPPLRAGGAS